MAITATMITPSTTAAMKNEVAVAVQPRNVRFGPSPCLGGASERSRGSLPIGSIPMGSLLIGVGRPGVGSVITRSSRFLSPGRHVEQHDDGDDDQDGDDDGDHPGSDAGVVNGFVDLERLIDALPAHGVLILLRIGGHEESPFPLDEADGTALGETIVAGTVPGTVISRRNGALLASTQMGSLNATPFVRHLRERRRRVWLAVNPAVVTTGWRRAQSRRRRRPGAATPRGARARRRVTLRRARDLRAAYLRCNPI